MHASLDPAVEQPGAVCGSGACHRSASMRVQRRSSSAVRGYSSLSIMFLSAHSAMSAAACGSIHVVTNVARFRRALPSSMSSSWTSWWASSGGSSWSGRRSLGITPGSAVKVGSTAASRPLPG
jgi:hypothetical protein